MNTQRPEWNDANNALVGNGVSMVTLYYMRRFFSFFEKIVESSNCTVVLISNELYDFFQKTLKTLETVGPKLSEGFSDISRKTVMDSLGEAASIFRQNIYNNGFSSQKKKISKDALIQFVKSSLTVIDHTIAVNKRNDNLYHAYNLMTVENEKEVSITHLSEMLEGQVAVLSSGYLSAQQSLEVLDGLKHSKLFREDQYSYLLYPNKQLPRFVERNNIPDEAVKNSKLLQLLLKNRNQQIIEQDVTGAYHFNGNFNNANSLNVALDSLENQYKSLVDNERETLLSTFENVFNHKAFTGRSGTFYGYEGLGSIYWHMVSKLLLAVQECCLKAINEKQSEEVIGRLLEHYYEINAGIGVHKSPELYGAFPTDPYSHTPGGKGAQQPGMTGQVKEDILSRFGELGVFVAFGKIHFAPDLLLKEEFLKQSASFKYIALDGKLKEMQLKEGQLAFTYCQVPIVYEISEAEHMLVHYKGDKKEQLQSLSLSEKLSKQLFGRMSSIERLDVFIKK